MLKIFRLIVCRLVLIYPVDCLCGVIQRSDFSLFISQLCNMIVYLIPKLSSDIGFRMMDAIFGLVIFKVLKLLVSTIFSG